MPYLLGIDVGTSGIKTSLFDTAGNAVASHTVEHPLLTPAPNWTEQNPEDWWNGTVATVRAVIGSSGVDPREIKGIGLSGQMHGSVFLDADHKVIRPCILWNDGRTAEQCRTITEKVGKKALHEACCNPALTGFTAPKVVWLQEKEPKNWERVRTIFLPKDYIRFRLTGEIACEMSDAAGTLLFDVPNRKWSEPVLAALGIDPAFMPPVYEATDACGKVTASVAQQTGLAAGTPVAGGGADNACGATGTGVVRAGRVLSSIGTSGTVVAPCAQVQVDPSERVHTFCHAVPRMWYVMGVVLSAGLSFRWVRDTIGAAEVVRAAAEGVDPYDLLTRLAGTAPVGSEVLLFLPYITGERTPHGDPDAKGAFIGLTIRHGREHLVRAALEGITFAMRDSFEIIEAMGVPVDEVRATGGGAKSPFWLQLQADVYGRPIATINTQEGASLGAALMGGVAAGVFKNLPEATDAIIKVVGACEPDMANHRRYTELFQLYTTQYAALKDTFARQSRLAVG